MTELTELLQQLVQIESINPDLVKTGSGESDLAHFIAEWAQRNGLEAELQETAPDRPNVIVRARGKGGGRTLMLNSHLDTVGVEGMDAPFRPHMDNGRMYGRGTYDMKASIAATLLAAKYAQDMSLPGDVLVSVVTDEEYASIGTESLIKDWPRWRADAVIVTEPTEMEVCIAHKGFVWLDVGTEGVAAHGSRPHLGIDAIIKMGYVLVQLDLLDRRLRQHPRHPYLKSGSLHASVINGGQGWSAYPAHCHLQVERRTLPDESPQVVCDEIQQVLDQLADNDPDFKADVQLNLHRPAFEVDPDEPIVSALQDATQSVLGESAPLAGNTFWMDAALFAEAGIPTVVFGPHGDGAHAAVEWVDLKSAEQCVAIYTSVIKSFCGIQED